MLAITPYPHIVNILELPCQGSNLDSSLSKREMLPITPQGNKARAEGFEPSSLQFRRLMCYPVTLRSHNGLGGTRTLKALRHLIYSQVPLPIWIPTQDYVSYWTQYIKAERVGVEPTVEWFFLQLFSKQSALPIATSPNSADGN